MTTFCRTCWTHYDPKYLPAECPHLDPEQMYVISGGVHRMVQPCGCPNCLAEVEQDL